MKRTLIAITILLTLLAGCMPARPGTPTPAAVMEEAGTLYVDPGRDLGPISPYVYGANYPFEWAIPAGRLQDFLNLPVTTLRFPAGGWGEHGDLLSVPFQIDTFMNLSKQLGAMPSISVRFLDGTPQAAANLVHYFNIEKKYGVVYWSIGNEPDYEKMAGRNIDTGFYNQQWRAIALAMKAVDPKIKLVGPEISQWGIELSKTPKNPPTQTPSPQGRQDWMTDFLKANGDLVDVVSVHRYPLYALTHKGPITADTLRMNTLEWEPMVTYLRGMVQQITGRELPIAFTEVNSDPSNVAGGDATPDSFYNAIWYADVLGHLINQDVFMVDYWAVAGSGGLGLLSTNEIRPTYYVFQMYSHFGNEQVYANTGMAFVDAFAAKRADGSLTLMVANLTDYEKRIPLKIAGMSPKQAQVWLLDASHNAADLGKQAIPPDGTLVLGAQSITLFAIGK